MNDPYKTPEVDLPVIGNEKPSGQQPRSPFARLAIISSASVAVAFSIIFAWRSIHQTVPSSMQKYLFFAALTVALLGVFASVVLIPIVIWKTIRRATS